MLGSASYWVTPSSSAGVRVVSASGSGAIAPTPAAAMAAL